MYVGHLIDKKVKSTTIKSYISGIKSVLADDGYQWDNSTGQFTALTHACRLKYDRVKTRLPITFGLLEILLTEIEKKYTKLNQYYLTKLYQSIFLLAYYGLLRIGEMAKGAHAVRACNVHAGRNKNKIMLVLFTSKTHGRDSRPQEIRIWADHDLTKVKFCPFEIVNDYGDIRGGYVDDHEQFFVFSDGSPVKPYQVRAVLRAALRKLKLNPKLYDTHSFRIGRASDLMKNGKTIDQIKKVGRWKSNAVFKYIRN